MKLQEGSMWWKIGDVCSYRNGKKQGGQRSPHSGWRVKGRGDCGCETRPQRALQTWTLKVTLTDALERKWPGQWPLGAHFEGQLQRRMLRRQTTLLEIRRNHHFLTKFGNKKETWRKAEVWKRGFPGGLVVGSLPCNAGITSSVPGLGKSHMLRGN